LVGIDKMRRKWQNLAQILGIHQDLYFPSWDTHTQRKKSNSVWIALLSNMSCERDTFSCWLRDKRPPPTLHMRTRYFNNINWGDSHTTSPH
jgi:hypothetical protein